MEARTSAPSTPWRPSVAAPRAAMCWAGASRLIKSGQRARPAEIAAKPFITLSRDSSLHIQTHDWFAAHSLQPRRLHLCNSIALLMRLALGMGVAILPRIPRNAGIRAASLLSAEVLGQPKSRQRVTCSQ